MHDNNDVLAEARKLWQHYLVLTNELLKFIDKGDIDTFLGIVPQRDSLIEKMKALPPNDFRATEECKKMIAEIKAIDTQVIYKARAWLNKSRRQNMTVKSYDLSAVRPIATGNIFNKKY